MAVQPMQPEITQLWEQILTSVRGRLESQQSFDTWFRPLVPRDVGPEVVDLECPSSFFVDWIHEHHLHTLRQSLVEVFGREPELRLTAIDPASQDIPELRETPEHAATSVDPVPAVRSSAALPLGRPPLGSPLHPRLTFEAFVVGTGNRFSHAACHAVRHRVPDARVCYVSAERFMNEMIFAIQHGQTLAFRNKYRSVDVLLVDDIQFIAGKEGTQDEFFYTFNALRDAHRQVVVTADKAPKDIPMLEERLISRFNQGLVTDVQQPDLETRIAILRNRCALDGGEVRIPDDVLLLIADRIRNNIRDLEGCLVRLMAYASLVHRDITFELAEQVLHQYVNPEPDLLTPERILAAVSERFSVKSEALCGQRRTKNIALPRQVAMYLLRQLTDLSFVEIGRVFGGRDHSTVMYACERVGDHVSKDVAFADKINGLISTLASG
jgi:chromosomal replication initiator protein